MAEYIDREAAMPDRFCVGVSCQECPFCDDPIKGGCKVARFIDAIPAADVVEREKGKWEEVEVDYISDMDKPPEAIASMFCPVCKRYANTIYFYGDPRDNMNFCPNCGAKMDAGKGERDA